MLTVTGWTRVAAISPMTRGLKDYEGGAGKVAVYAKNRVAKVLAGAVGGKVSVKFKRLDKGLFALEARPAA